MERGHPVRQRAEARSGFLNRKKEADKNQSITPHGVFPSRLPFNHGAQAVSIYPTRIRERWACVDG